mgnify:CR=1 FL=1
MSPKAFFASAGALALALAAPAAGEPASDPAAADLVDLYTHLHANPELSLQEDDTSALLAGALERMAFEVTTGLGDEWVRAKAERDQGGAIDEVGGYGVVGVMENGKGPTVLIRADMDALPVNERTGLDYASQVTDVTWTGVESGVMHACGHDIHMTSWVGTARELVARRDEWSGTLVMILQPAEELGLGAQAMLADGLFERFPLPDYNLALHVSASTPAGTVAYSPGYAMANVDSVDITVKGVGGHGAYPHTTKDPVVVAAHIVTALQTIVSRNVDPQEPAVVTVGAIEAGSKHNIISDEAHLKLTVRSYDDTTRDLLLSRIERIAKGQAQSFGAPEPDVVVESDYTPSTYNDPDLTEKAVTAISGAIGEDNVMQVPPVMGGEDFSQYGRTGEKVPSLLFWVGAVAPETYRKSQDKKLPLPSLHSPFFTPDAPATIETGVKSMTATAIALFEKG